MRGLASLLATDSLVRRAGDQDGRLGRLAEALAVDGAPPMGPPSLDAAVAAAFTVGVGKADPVLAVPIAVMAAGVLAARAAQSSDTDVASRLAGAALGTTVALAVNRLVPARTPTPLRPVEPVVVPQEPRPTGAGVVAVVNPRSGGGRGARLAAAVRDLLPGAELIVLDPDDDVGAAMRAAAARAEVLGVIGGDGTVQTAAAVATQAGHPLLVFPGGTFNHFAADLGVDRLSDAVRALAQGTAIEVDVGLANGKPFLNTSSLGRYPTFVRIREQWEGRVGKPVAAAIALVLAGRRERPIRVIVDGREHLVAMMFVGNGRYQPHGFAPSWRPRLDDGRLDLRILTFDRRFALLRILASLLTGRLGRSSLYIEDDPVDLRVELPDGPAPLARDGEVGPGGTRIDYCKARRALTVYRPRRGEVGLRSPRTRRSSVAGEA